MENDSAAYQRQARREAASVSAAMLFVVGAAIVGLWVTSTDTAREDFRHYLIGLAASAATMVDPVLQNQLRRAVPDIHYLYTFAEDHAGGVHFVLDAADPNATNRLGQPEQSGVEDATQLAILQALGCHYAQGYFLGRPVPAERLLDAMAEPDRYDITAPYVGMAATK